ncbi:MAG: LytTR family transcriptional regulator [Saprospiraceae bacterium]|nr:LytTR family transcriptional regulator [Candidatus Opimibacter skivensis]MBL0005642.1 LytTR family transcriptional regulator [Candidatus Opimibacter skivensis]
MNPPNTMIIPRHHLLNHDTLLVRESILKSKHVDAADIILIRGEGTYSWIYLTSGQQLFTSRTVKYWVNWFNSDGLIRVHRSYVINSSQIEQIELRSMRIRMHGGHKVTIARSKIKMIRQLWHTTLMIP